LFVLISIFLIFKLFALKNKVPWCFGISFVSVELWNSFFHCLWNGKIPLSRIGCNIYLTFILKVLLLALNLLYICFGVPHTPAAIVPVGYPKQAYTHLTFSETHKMQILCYKMLIIVCEDMWCSRAKHAQCFIFSHTM